MICLMIDQGLMVVQTILVLHPNKFATMPNAINPFDKQLILYSVYDFKE